jgi:hypothetical protein
VTDQAAQACPASRACLHWRIDRSSGPDSRRGQRCTTHAGTTIPPAARDARRSCTRIALDFDESSDGLADLLSAVESFERAVSLLGGDGMVDSPDTTDPDHPDQVLPRRHDDESLRAYTTRVRNEASRLETSAATQREADGASAEDELAARTLHLDEQIEPDGTESSRNDSNVDRVSRARPGLARHRRNR